MTTTLTVVNQGERVLYFATYPAGSHPSDVKLITEKLNELAKKTNDPVFVSPDTDLKLNLVGFGPDKVTVTQDSEEA